MGVFLAPALAAGALAQPAPPERPSWPTDIPAAVTDVLDALPGLAVAVSLPRLLGKTVVFVAVFLLVGLFSTALARGIVYAGLGDAQRSRPLAPKLARRMAIWALVAWSVALLLASEAIGMGWLAALVTAPLEAAKVAAGLIGSVVVGCLWVVAAAVVAYAISPRGQDIVLSLAGWWYLHYRPGKSPQGMELDLGDGSIGRVVSVDALHTTPETADGRQHTRANAWVMRTHFNWGEATLGGSTVAAPPSPPVPPSYGGSNTAPPA